MERENDVVCHYQNDFGLGQNIFNIGKFYEGWDGRFKFYYDKAEGAVLTDYIANDKGWFVVSQKLKSILETMNTEIQFLSVQIEEKNGNESIEGYYIAKKQGNLLRRNSSTGWQSILYISVGGPENVYICMCKSK